jgi:hypothetical protein
MEIKELVNKITQRWLRYFPQRIARICNPCPQRQKKLNDTIQQHRFAVATGKRKAL